MRNLKPAGIHPSLWALALIVVAVVAGLLWFGRPGTGPALSAQTGSAGGKNLLLITLDTVRSDRLGCYGCRDVQTPVIDALAAGGARFTDAAAPTPMTLPSHATLMTGLHPPRHGVRDNGKFRLADEHLTLAEHLAQSGYATGAFIGAFVLDKRFGLGQGFDVYDDEMAASRRFSGVHGGSPQRPGDIVTDTALAWLTGQLDEQPGDPFFAWVHLFDAHTPYDPPEPFATTYRDNRYLGEIAFLDQQVGRLVGFLRARSLLDQTLVVIVGDHGEGLGEHNEDTHSRLIYESTMSVPMIWHCPPVLGEPRVVSDRVVSLADVTPTILDLVGLAVPAATDGLSLLDEAPPDDRAVYIETLAPQLNHGWSPLYGLRRHRDKFIEAPTPEYYDLSSDPRELQNRFSPSNKKAVALRALLADVRVALETGAVDGERSVPVDDATREMLASLGYIDMPIGGNREELADPKDMMPLYRKNLEATALANLGRSADAVTLYREILEETPEDGTAWMGLSLALGQQAELDDAIEAARTATQLQPDQRHWIHLARLHMEKGDDEAYLASLEQAQAAVPADGEIHLLRGERLLRTGDYDEAMRCFEKAREVDPSRVSVSAHVLTGRALVKLHNLAEAREAYGRALYCDPNDLRALDELADLDERAGNHDVALPARRRLCELRPHSMLYANKLSALFFELDQPDEAVAALRALAERQPEDPAALGNYANALLTAGRLNRAVATYRQAIDLNPRYVIARYNLAEALVESGDVEGAIQQCREALASQADFTPARHRLLVLLTGLNRLDEAIAELDHAAPHGLVDWSDLVNDSRLRQLVDDPRFAALRARTIR